MAKQRRVSVCYDSGNSQIKRLCEGGIPSHLLTSERENKGLGEPDENQGAELVTTPTGVGQSPLPPPASGSQLRPADRLDSSTAPLRQWVVSIVELGGEVWAREVNQWVTWTGAMMAAPVQFVVWCVARVLFCRGDLFHRATMLHVVMPELARAIARVAGGGAFLESAQAADAASDLAAWAKRTERPVSVDRWCKRSVQWSDSATAIGLAAELEGEALAASVALYRAIAHAQSAVGAALSYDGEGFARDVSSAVHFALVAQGQPAGSKEARQRLGVAAKCAGFALSPICLDVYARERQAAISRVGLEGLEGLRDYANALIPLEDAHIFKRCGVSAQDACRYRREGWSPLAIEESIELAKETARANAARGGQ